MKRNGLILAYHRVSFNRKDPLAIPVEDFREQINYFHERGYSSFTLEEYATMVNRGSLPKKSVVITFDDGYRDNYLYAFPILKHFGFHGTIFLTANYIGTNNIFPMDKAKNWSRILDDDLPLTWEQVFKMKEYGMEFGAHTCSHWHLDELPEKEMITEIVESKRHLEEKLQIQVKSFCYPSGRFNQQVKEIVRKSGYTSAVVTPRHGQRDEDMYSLKRIGIYFNDSGWRFRLKISPCFPVIRDSGLLYHLKRIIPARFFNYKTPG